MLTKDTLSGVCLARIHDVLREHARFRKCEHVNLDAIIKAVRRSAKTTSVSSWSACRRSARASVSSGSRLPTSLPSVRLPTTRIPKLRALRNGSEQVPLCHLW